MPTLHYFRMIAKQAAELETEAAQIKAGTHPGLRAELKAIEERKKARLCVLLAQKDYLCQMAESNFEAVRKAAQDQYQVGDIPFSNIHTFGTSNEGCFTNTAR